MQPGYETDRLTPSVAKFKSKCSYTYTTYSFLDLAGTNSLPQNNLLLVYFFKSAFLQFWVGALLVFSADEELSAMKWF